MKQKETKKTSGKNDGVQVKSSRSRGIFSLFFTRYNFSKIVSKNFIFDKLSDKKKTFKDSSSGVKIRF